MLNDRSSALSLLETRRSGKPRELVGPGPTAAEMERILTIAARIPDHGKLIRGGSSPSATTSATRSRRCCARRWRKRTRTPPTAHFEKEHEFAHYAGQLVVLVSAPVEDHKIPVWEQQLSCGAAGMNLLLAAHALGYVAGWVTGWRAYSERVRARLLRARASGSPGSSSSATAARARGTRPPGAGNGREAMAAAGSVTI